METGVLQLLGNRGLRRLNFEHISSGRLLPILELPDLPCPLYEMQIADNDAGVAELSHRWPQQCGPVILVVSGRFLKQ